MSINYFRTHCLALLKLVNAKQEIVVITKRGRPVAKLVPFHSRKPEIFGFMKGKGRVIGDVVAPAFSLAEWGDLK